MKICFLMYQGNMYSGGQGVYLFYLTRELARMGHEVHVIAGPPYPTLDERVTTHDITDYSYWTYHHYKKDFVFNRPPLSYFHPVNFYDFISTRIALSSLLANFSVRAYFKLRELAREHRFDVVHDNQTLSYGVWATHASGFPLVATIHHPLSYDLKNQLRQARSTYEKARRILWSPWYMQEWTAKSADRVIVVSETSRVDVEEAFQLPPEKVRTVYNGIDVDTFRPLPGVERLPDKLLYVGNSEDRNKGARYFLKALDILKDEIDFQVTFVDNVKHNLKLAPKLVDEYGLNSRVDFTGRIPTEDLVRHYNEAKLLVTSSVHEGRRRRRAWRPREHRPSSSSRSRGPDPGSRFLSRLGLAKLCCHAHEPMAKRPAEAPYERFQPSSRQDGALRAPRDAQQGSRRTPG